MTAAPMSLTRGFLLAIVFVLTLPAVTPRLYASDEVQYFSYLRSLWFDHDVSFENEYRYFYDRGTTRNAGFHETFLERTTETSRRINFGTIGCALLWAPFYAVADLVTRARSGQPGAWAVDGFSAPYVVAVSFASALYGFLALVISARVARRWTGAGAVPAVLVGIGTPLIFYMYVAPPMSHACSAFAVAIFIATWLRVREHWSAAGLVGLGLLAALMAMVREQDAFFVIAPALDFARTWRRRLRHGAGPGETTPVALAGNLVGGVVAGVIGYLPQALASLALNGYLGPSRLVARKMTWTAPHAVEVLFSPEHGFFVWTPLAVIALAGLAWAAATSNDARTSPRDVQWIAFCLLVATALQVYVAGSVESWTVAGAFGQRRFIALTLVLVFGLAALLQLARSRRTRGALLVAAAVCVWWNLGLIFQFGAGLMDRQRLEPSRNAYTTFVVLPRVAPQMAVRYLFARDSYYRPPSP